MTSLGFLRWLFPLPEILFHHLILKSHLLSEYLPNEDYPKHGIEITNRAYTSNTLDLTFDYFAFLFC